MDSDALYDSFDDLALLFAWKRRPAGVEVLGLADDLFLRKKADPHGVNLGLGTWDFIPELFQPFANALVARSEAVLVDRPGLIQVIEFVGLGRHLALFALEDGQQFFPFLEVSVAL
jgi:hypothetical protein